MFSFLFLFHSKNSPAVTSSESYALVQTIRFTDEAAGEWSRQVTCPKPRAPLSLEHRSSFINNNKPINLSIPLDLNIYTLCNFNPNNFYLRPHPFLGMVTSYTLSSRKIKRPCVCGFLCVCLAEMHSE